MGVDFQETEALTPHWGTVQPRLHRPGGESVLPGSPDALCLPVDLAEGMGKGFSELRAILAHRATWLGHSYSA